MPILIKGQGGKTWPTYALLDSGATTICILTDIADRADVKRKSLLVKLGTFDNEPVTDYREIAEFTISNLQGDFELTIKNALVGNLLATEGEKPPTQSQIAKYPHFSGLILNTLPDKTIGVIIDVRYASAWMTGEVREGKENEPIALSTKFGWSIAGPRLEETNEKNNICLIDMEPLTLTDEVRRLFRHDFISRENEFHPPEMTHPSTEDRYSMKQIKESIKFNEDTGHYVVSLPWRLGREKSAQILSNIDFYSNAESRLRKLKNRLQRNPELRKLAFDQINKTITQGHAQILNDLSVEPNHPLVYLPQVLIVRDDKPGKCRVTQDANPP